MPRDLNVSFVAVDEIQLAADLDRGHVFTDRLLHLRGTRRNAADRRRHDAPSGAGAAARGPDIRAPAPFQADFRRRQENHPAAPAQRHRRFFGRGCLRHRRMDPPPMRRRGGGARRAVAAHPQRPGRPLPEWRSSITSSRPTPSAWASISMSITSPSPRDRKFDGWQHRRLNPAEFGQIAGRAGRHLRDGTFGTTGRCPPFDEELDRTAGRPPLRSGAHAAMAQRRSRFFLDRGPHGLARRTAGRCGSYARARGRRPAGARNRRPRRKSAAGGQDPSRYRHACGNAAKFPIIARLRRPRTPISCCPFSALSCARAIFRTTGSPAMSRQHRPHRRRHRHAFGAHRPGPNLDLHRQSN